MVFRKGYGLANLAAKTPVRPETTFDLGSVTKQFTGMAVCILHDRGKLSFDDPARKYIPELPEAAKNIRIRDMLNHISGLPDFTYRLPQPPGRSETRQLCQQRGLTPRRSKTTPSWSRCASPTGQQYEYSNTNYMLLGLIVQRVSKKRYGTFVEDEILKPLGMTHSWVYDHPRDAPKDSKLGYLNALGYSKNGNAAWTPSWGSPPFLSHTFTRQPAPADCGAVWTTWPTGTRPCATASCSSRRPGRRYSSPRKHVTARPMVTGSDWNLGLDDKGKLTSFGHGGVLGRLPHRLLPKRLRRLCGSGVEQRRPHRQHPFRCLPVRGEDKEEITPTARGPPGE